MHTYSRKCININLLSIGYPSSRIGQKLCLMTVTHHISNLELIDAEQNLEVIFNTDLLETIGEDELSLILSVIDWKFAEEIFSDTLEKSISEKMNKL